MFASTAVRASGSNKHDFAFFHSQIKIWARGVATIQNILFIPEQQQLPGSGVLGHIFQKRTRGAIPQTRLTLHYTGVHCFNLECNTAMNVLVYYTLPGVRVIHSSHDKYRRGSNRASALQQKRRTRAIRGLNLLSRYPRGLVVKALVCHPIVKGSMPTLAMIFLHGFHKCPSFSCERERK